MKQIELCEALGLSKSQVSKLVARGMPTDSAEAAEAWRRQNLEPMMAYAHRHRKARDSLLHQAPANPIDATVFGVIPQLLFDRLPLLKVLTDAGIQVSDDEFVWFAAYLSTHYWQVLVHQMGFPAESELNLPPWLTEVPE